jgi:hypothetical protein
MILSHTPAIPKQDPLLLFSESSLAYLKPPVERIGTDEIR